jgi:type IV pilus assembly protein PilE
MKYMQKYKSRNCGFTLTEVLITLAILAVLAVIAYPMYTGYMSGSKRTEAKTNLQALRLLIEQYYAENSKYCPDAAGACSNKSYTYTEDASGGVLTRTINPVDGTYLTGFKPKGAASTNAVLYDYTIALTSNTAYTITASPAAVARSSPAPSGNLTITQDGAKTGQW